MHTHIYTDTPTLNKKQQPHILSKQPYTVISLDSILNLLSLNQQVGNSTNNVHNLMFLKEINQKSTCKVRIKP